MRKVFFRYLAYAAGVTAMISAIMLIAMKLPVGMQFDLLIEDKGVVTSEFSPVEIVQNLMLIFCAGAFAWIASRDRLRRPMAVGFFALFGACLIRELDFFLDFYLLDNLWQVLTAVLLSVGFVYCIRSRHRFVQGWRRSWPSAGLAMIIAGMILLIPFAQLVGHEALWKIIMGDQYVRLVKIASEEFIELGAYAVITMGAIEFLYTWSRLPRTRNIAAPPRRR